MEVGPPTDHYNAAARSATTPACSTTTPTSRRCGAGILGVPRHTRRQTRRRTGQQGTLMTRRDRPTRQNRRAAMNKPTIVEIPLNADERIIRIQLEQIAKAVKAARPRKTERVVVTIQQQQQ